MRTLLLAVALGSICASGVVYAQDRPSTGLSPNDRRCVAGFASHRVATSRECVARRDLGFAECLHTLGDAELACDSTSDRNVFTRCQGQANRARRVCDMAARSEFAFCHAEGANRIVDERAACMSED